MAWYSNLSHKILELTHGRCTAFFIAFFVTGNVFAAFGKLTTTYVAFMATLGGLVLGHSIKEDVMAASGTPPPAPTPGGEGQDVIDKS